MSTTPHNHNNKPPDERFKVASTLPGINHKLKINIEDDAEKIYWYIKFNLYLDKRSVTNKTMQVMDTDGYIMRTYIAYDTDRHLIVVSPMDTYKQNTYYILSISTDVRSDKGQNLKKEIHIMFMLINNKISKYEILKSTAKLPKPKPRPHNYDDVVKMAEDPVKLEGPSEREADIGISDDNHETLSFMHIKVNPTLVLAGLPTLGVGFFTGIVPVFFAGVFIFVIGFVVVARQVYKVRPHMLYNLGAYYFNKQRYLKAEGYIKRSFDIDRNQHARYGLRRVKRYLAALEEELEEDDE